MQKSIIILPNLVTDVDNGSSVEIPVSSEFRDSSVYFLCENDEVISVLGRCDGNRDCTDQSDETGCDDTSSGMFT